MTRLFILALAGISSAATAQPGPDAQGETMVVTGTPLRDSERALRDCIARRCPPLEDISATLAHAENQFVAGDYEGARTTLFASRRRNNRAAEQHPVPVSMLYRASARITRHMGEDQEYERHARGIVQTLNRGLPANHPQTLIGRFDVADMYVHQGLARAGQQEYESIARIARAANQKVIAAHADLRAAYIALQLNPGPAARARLQAIATNGDPEVRSIALGARVLLARIGYEGGDPNAADAVIRELASTQMRRTLIHAPPMQPIRFGNTGNRARSGEGATGNPWHYSEPETNRETWIDVGFRITANGTVEEAQILRSQGSTGWTAPVLSSIRGRRYSPSTDQSDDYRVERYSFTSAKMEVTGTRMQRHSGEWRIEQLDLTE